MEMDQKTFIGRISQALGRDHVPDHIEPAYDYSSGLQFSRLRGLDAAGLRAQLASQQKVRDFTMLTCDKDSLAATLAGIAQKEQPQRVVVPADTSDDGIDLVALAQKITDAEIVAYDRHNDPASQRAKIEQADFSITIPFRAIADTGTVLELADDRCGKIVSLLAPAHISVIFQSRLKATLTDVAPELDAMGENGPLPTYFLFISGPSSTGDIESVMVTGVHGPTREYVVVVEDL